MGWLEEQYKGTQTLGDDGKISGRGLGAFLWQQFVDEDAINRESQKNLNTKTAIAGGEDIDDLTGIDDTSSVYDVQGALKRKERERAAATKAEDLAASLKPLEMRIAEDGKQRAAELQLAREKLAQSNNLTLLQLSQQNDQKIAELQYQKMRDRKNDQQYNERMEQLDRRDRRTAMQNMAAGLASLGAAFAL